MNGGIFNNGELTMSSVAGATAYEFKLATSPGTLDSSPILDNTAYTSNTMYIVTSSMRASTAYYWEARAKTENGWDSSWSPVFSFTTNTTRPWTDQSNAGWQHWRSIASSADGTHLAACTGTYYGDIWTSTNSGATWIDQTASGGPQNQNWQSIASSADGTHLAAVVSGGDIWTSANSGATWIDQTPTGSAHNRYWQSIASSADGTHLAAVVYSGDIWTSANSGATWIDQTPTGIAANNKNWESIASNSDGTHLAAVVYSGDIWTSTNSGATWIDQTPTGSALYQYWLSIASSADGTHLAAVEYYGDIWTGVVAP
jgi:hypothetical protein